MCLSRLVVSGFKTQTTITTERIHMKRIKIYVEGGVVQDVIFEGLIKDEEMTYEVIDYDEMDARENEKNKKQQASEQKG
jgi:hypothetical protein